MSFHSCSTASTGDCPYFCSSSNYFAFYLTASPVKPWMSLEQRGPLQWGPHSRVELIHGLGVTSRGHSRDAIALFTQFLYHGILYDVCLSGSILLEIAVDALSVYWLHDEHLLRFGTSCIHIGYWVGVLTHLRSFYLNSFHYCEDLRKLMFKKHSAWNSIWDDLYRLPYWWSGVIGGPFHEARSLRSGNELPRFFSFAHFRCTTSQVCGIVLNIKCR